MSFKKKNKSIEKYDDFGGKAWRNATRDKSGSELQEKTTKISLAVLPRFFPEFSFSFGPTEVTRLGA